MVAIAVGAPAGAAPLALFGDVVLFGDAPMLLDGPVLPDVPVPPGVVVVGVVLAGPADGAAGAALLVVRAGVVAIVPVKVPVGMNTHIPIKNANQSTPKTPDAQMNRVVERNSFTSGMRAANRR